jgi:hypothetical protein
LPLGLAAVKFWSRSKFKGTNALKRSINPTRVPTEEKESMCWLDNVRPASALLGQPEQCVHIGDRESHIYELFCQAQEAGADFIAPAPTDWPATAPVQCSSTRGRCVAAGSTR